jgi:hypothetical protein
MSERTARPMLSPYAREVARYVGIGRRICTRFEETLARAERVCIAAFLAFTRESETASASEFERLRCDASEAKLNSKLARLEFERHALIHARANWPSD